MREQLGACAIAAVFCAIAAPWARAEWGTYQGNAQHTGYVAGQYDMSKFQPLWQVPVGTGSLPLQPFTVGGGKVFVTREIYFQGVPSVFALDAETGATRWSKTFYAYGMPSAGGVANVSQAAYANGRVYVQSTNHQTDSYLWCFDANTSGLVFRTPFDCQWEKHYAPVVVGNEAYITTGWGSFQSHDATTGAFRWASGGGYMDGFSPAVEGDRIYQYNDGRFFTMNRADGALLHEVIDPAFATYGTLDNATVRGPRNDVIGMARGPSPPSQTELISLDTTTQTLRWTKKATFTSLQPTVAHDLIFVAAGRTLQARSEMTGDVVWSWNMPAGDAGELERNLVATDNLLFCGSDFRTYAVDLASRASVWSHPFGGHLALSDQKLFIAGTDGQMTAIQLPEPTAAAAAASLIALARRRPRRPRPRSFNRL
jgi:outer membrane protein assembly factor BamB